MKKPLSMLYALIGILSSSLGLAFAAEPSSPNAKAIAIESIYGSPLMTQYEKAVIAPGRWSQSHQGNRNRSAVNIANKCRNEPSHAA